MRTKVNVFGVFSDRDCKQQIGHTWELVPWPAGQAALAIIRPLRRRKPYTTPAGALKAARRVAARLGLEVTKGEMP